MLMEEYLPIRFKKKTAMSISRAVLLFTFLLSISNQSVAQAISKDYQKNCVSEQVSGHQGLNGKPFVEEDFTAYCYCHAEFISKNASNRQVNELVMNPKAKPEWLKVIELKAMKACISLDSKLTT